MNSEFKSTILGMAWAGLINAAVVMSASAAFVVSGGSMQNLPVSGNDFNGDLAALGIDQVSTGAQLRVDQDGFVDFFYIGAESGFTNSFTAGTNTVTENNEDFNFSGYLLLGTAVS